MRRYVFLASALLAACAAAPTPAPLVPTVTLRAMPTFTASPIFPTPPPTNAPAPTSTLAPTPTPAAYTIKQGDTLIGIAIAHNISVEAIESANPGIDPGNLQPGQIIFLPAPENGAPSVGVAPTPLPLAVGAFTCAPTPVASLICFGEFTNTTDQPIANLSVTVTLSNADNSTGESAAVFAPFDLIPTGVAVPLAAVFANGNQRAALAAILSAESGAALADRYAMLAVSDARGESSSGGFTLSGAVSNPTSITVSNVALVGTVYNSAGSVIGYRKIMLTEPLAANASAQFSVTLPGVESAARWAVIAQGRTP